MFDLFNYGKTRTKNWQFLEFVRSLTVLEHIYYNDAKG